MSKRIICLIGPSGSGKTYIGTKLKEKGYIEIVSHTTREKRFGEVDGKDYHFVSITSFFKEEMIEKNYYSGNFYGTSTKEIKDRLSTSDYLYQVTTYSGFEAVKKAFPGVDVFSVYIQASQETREERMSLRGDSLSSIQKRISVDTSKWETDRSRCDYILDNSMDQSVTDAISQMEKKLSQQK